MSKHRTFTGTMKLKKYDRYGLFGLCAAITALSWWFYRHQISLPPQFSHAWSMSDYYAIALNFKQHGFNLFVPHTYNLNTVDGITGGDLTFPAWCSSILMLFCGTEEPIVFRVLTWVVSTLGFVFLYRTMSALNNEETRSLRAAGLSLLVWLLPTLVYFHDGFIPSTWALSAFMVGLWAMLAAKNKFGLAVAAFTLAALIRKPYVLWLCALAIWTWQYHPEKKRWRLWGLGMGIFIGWQLYDLYMNSVYGSIFLREIRPPESMAELFTLWKQVWTKWGLIWFSPVHLLWPLLAGLLWKKAETAQIQMKGWMVLAGFGLACGYAIAMLRQFNDHDYYVIDSFYPAFILLVMWLSARTAPTRMQVWVELLFLLPAIYWAANVQHTYINSAQFIVSEKTNRVYYASRPLLEQLQIPKDAKMMVFEAYSFNQPLIGMRRNGYCLQTSYYKVQETNLALKPDYVTCLDTFFVSEIVRDNPAIVHELAYVGGNTDLLVFKPQLLPNQSLESLLADQWQTIIDSANEDSDAEYMLSKTIKPMPDAKVLFYGQLSMNEASEIRATMALFKDGKPISVNERPLKTKQVNQITFGAISIETGHEPADEMRIYLWNPNHLKVHLADFSISIIQPRNKKAF
jgi:hypothetical protein